MFFHTICQYEVFFEEYDCPWCKNTWQFYLGMIWDVLFIFDNLVKGTVFSFSVEKKKATHPPKSGKGCIFFLSQSNLLGKKNTSDFSNCV